MEKTIEKTSETVHPGLILKKVLETRLMNTEDLARLSKYDSEHFKKIIRGDNDIDQNTSQELERLLSIESSFWLMKQKDYNTIH
ncbi:MAG: hypothetical protein Q4P28_01765 [Tissierellia bacterium]|nr:hypothetical protein [Tissierellia bacterium]